MRRKNPNTGEIKACFSVVFWNNTIVKCLINTMVWPSHSQLKTINIQLLICIKIIQMMFLCFHFRVGPTWGEQNTGSLVWLCSIHSSASRENYEGVELNTRSLEISEQLLAAIQNLFCLLFDVYLPRGVCSSRLLLQVPWASQVMDFLWLIPRHDLASSRPLSSRGFLKECPFSKPPNLSFCIAKLKNFIAIGFPIVWNYEYKKIAFAFIWPLKAVCHVSDWPLQSEINTTDFFVNLCIWNKRGLIFLTLENFWKSYP